jgi:hypothetical protein
MTALLINLLLIIWSIAVVLFVSAIIVAILSTYERVRLIDTILRKQIEKEDAS